MKRKAQPRTTVSLSNSGQHQLHMYALAASAAGVAALSSVQPAQAKIIYTPAHQALTGSVPIDLDHDGEADIAFVNRTNVLGTFTFSSFLGVQYAVSSAIPQFVATGKADAVALRGGARIGPGRHFRSGASLWDKLIQGFPTNHSSRTYWFGQWANGGKGLKHRYLGIKFTINGSSHYGWARISVSISGNKATSLLTGYAYETIANKPIVAGATKGPDVVVAPTTLGDLAAGASGLHRVPFRPQRP